MGGQGLLVPTHIVQGGTGTEQAGGLLELGIWQTAVEVQVLLEGGQGFLVPTHPDQGVTGAEQAEGLLALGVWQTAVEVQGVLVGGQGLLVPTHLAQGDAGVAQAVGLLALSALHLPVELQRSHKGCDRLWQVPGFEQLTPLVKSLFGPPQDLLWGEVPVVRVRHGCLLSVVSGYISAHSVLLWQDPPGLVWVGAGHR